MLPKLSGKVWFMVSFGVLLVTFLCPAMSQYALFELEVGDRPLMAAARRALARATKPLVCYAVDGLPAKDKGLQEGSDEATPEELVRIPVPHVATIKAR